MGWLRLLASSQTHMAGEARKVLFMLRIRLRRMGAKKAPHYRIVVVDSRKRRDGAYIESLGNYDPRETTEEWFTLNEERAKHWLDHGAQPSLVVLKLLERKGVEVGNVLIKRSQQYREYRKAFEAKVAA